MTMSMNQLKKTLKSDLISMYLSAQCKAELHAQYSAELETKVAKLQRQLDALSIARDSEQRQQQRGSAASKETWYIYFDFVKRDRNPHGPYVNARIREDVPEPNLDIIQQQLLPYARKVSPVKVDAKGHRWINIYY